MKIKSDTLSKQNYCLSITSVVDFEIWGTDISFFICTLDSKGKEN